VLAREADRSRIGVGVGEVDETANDVADVDARVLASKEIQRMIDGPFSGRQDLVQVPEVATCTAPGDGGQLHAREVFERRDGDPIFADEAGREHVEVARRAVPEVRGNRKAAGEVARGRGHAHERFEGGALRRR
jgi:hypothetical protein